MVPGKTTDCMLDESLSSTTVNQFNSRNTVEAHSGAVAQTTLCIALC